MAGSILEFDTVQKIQVLSDAGMCLKPYSQCVPHPHPVPTVPEPQFHILSEQITLASKEVGGIYLYLQSGHFEQ